MRATHWAWLWIALLHASAHAEPQPHAQAGPLLWPAQARAAAQMPAGQPPIECDDGRIDKAIDTAFTKRGTAPLPDTRALLVVHGGRMTRERYASGYGPDTLMPPWSLSKAFLQALTGVLVAHDRLKLDAPVEIDAWQQPGAGRITLRHLLQMTAGLDADDVDGQGHDQQHTFLGSLLYGARSADTLAAATSAPMLHEPGTHWSYSTAQTVIASALVLRSVGGQPESLQKFIETELARPLGMREVVTGFDAVGNFLGGSDVYLSARDWARLGLLYLHDGVAGDRRILPEGWVEFTRTRSGAAGSGTFGALVWLPGVPTSRQIAMPAPTPQSFVMFGLFGQFVVVVPEADLVVVRMGTLRQTSWEEITGALREIAFACLPTGEAR